MPTLADSTIFTFAPPGRIIFGPDCARELPSLTASLGSRALLVRGPRNPNAAASAHVLKHAGLLADEFIVAGEPTTDDINAGRTVAQTVSADVIVAVGGGSVIDAAKAIAALCTNPGDIFRYLETIGDAQPLLHSPLPCIAVPTTAGTGAEVTFNAVIASPTHCVKVSLRHVNLAPRIALVDPLLTHSLPPDPTAASGMDAITQLIEAYVSRQATLITDLFCREGLIRAAHALPRAFQHGDDARARADMSLAALLSGLALANARLGAVHALAGPLGGLLHAPHGALCGRLLPFVTQANISALRESTDPYAPFSLARYAEIARFVGAGSNPEDVVTWADALAQSLRIPPLSSYGLTNEHFSQVISQALAASSMKTNPVPLTPSHLSSLLRRAL